MYSPGADWRALSGWGEWRVGEKAGRLGSTRAQEDSEAFAMARWDLKHGSPWREQLAGCKCCFNNYLSLSRQLANSISRESSPS